MASLGYIRLSEEKVVLQKKITKTKNIFKCKVKVCRGTFVKIDYWGKFITNEHYHNPLEI